MIKNGSRVKFHYTLKGTVKLRGCLADWPDENRRCAGRAPITLNLTVLPISFPTQKPQRLPTAPEFRLEEMTADELAEARRLALDW